MEFSTEAKINSYTLVERQKHTIANQELTRGFGESLRNAAQKCPYSALAKDGMIEYNGVVFNCDYKHNAITLGDVTSNPKKVLNIALPSGGNLKVNIDNLGDLAKAAGMFSPEDLNAIMRAIHQYKFCAAKLNEIEEEENSSVEENAAAPEEETSEEIAMKQLQSYRQLLFEKIIHNDTEQTFVIGGQEFTNKEWDRLLEDFDDAQEQVRELLEEKENNNKTEDL